MAHAIWRRRASRIPPFATVQTDRCRPTSRRAVAIESRIIRHGARSVATRAMAQRPYRAGTSFCDTGTTLISTRRLAARPCSVSFDSIGCVSPKPRVAMRAACTPWLDR